MSLAPTSGNYSIKNTQYEKKLELREAFRSINTHTFASASLTIAIIAAARSPWQ